MKRLIQKLIERFYPISPLCRVFAAQFSGCDTIKLDYHQGVGMLEFTPTGRAPATEAVIGSDIRNIQLFLTPKSAELVDISRPNWSYVPNRRELKLLQNAAIEWMDMDGISANVVVHLDVAES